MKKYLSSKITVFFATLTALVPSFVSAKSILENLTGSNEADDLSAIETLIGNLASIALNISGVLAVIMLIFGGITYITSAGNPDQAEKGKKFATFSIIGILVIIFSFYIVKIFAGFIGGDFG